MLTAKRSEGPYDFTIRVEEIQLLMNKYNYAARVIAAIRRDSGEDVLADVDVAEHHGVLAEEAVTNAVAAAMKSLSNNRISRS